MLTRASTTRTMMSRSGPDPATGSVTARDVLQPSFTTQTILYHTVTRRRLVELTELGLAATGVLPSALGLREDDTITLTGCIVLNDHARSRLPTALGGSSGSLFGSPFSSPTRGSPPSASPASNLTPTRPHSEPSPASLARAAESAAAAADAATAARLSHARLLAAQERLRTLRPRAHRAAAASDEPNPDEPPPADDSDAVAELMDAVAAAHAHDTAAAEARARSDSDTASILSSLRLSPEHTPTPPPPGDSSRDQQNLVASVTSLTQTNDAIAILMSFRRTYPNIHRAFLQRSGDVPVIDLTEFPTTILVPAVHAARTQAHGLKILRESARAHAHHGGPRGAAAANELDTEFDYRAAQEILCGRIDLRPSPLDACLGVLPLAQLALHFWYKNHHYQQPPDSMLIAASAAITFVHDGTLDPYTGLAKFFPLWGDALGANDDIPSPIIYFNLVKALQRESEAPGAAQTFTTINGSPTSWSAFATSTVAEYRQRTNGTLDGQPPRTHSTADLETLIFNLDRFATARRASDTRLDPLVPPPGYDAPRNVRIAAAPPTPPTPPISPPTTPPPPTKNRRKNRRQRRDQPPPTPAFAVPPALPPRPPTLLLPVMVMPAVTTTDILSASALLAAGWEITFSNSHDGSRITIPGHRGSFPIALDSRGNPWVTLTPAFGQPNPTFELYNPADPNHTIQPRYPFLLDTGAEHSVVSARSLNLLADLNSIPLVPILGVGGPPIMPAHSGLLRLVGPPGSRPSPTAPSVPITLAHARTGLLRLRYLTTPGPVTVHRVRATAFPAHRDAAILAERLNLKDGAAYTAFRKASPFGIADDAPWPDPDTTYDRPHHLAGAGKKHPVFSQRPTFSLTLKDCMPPGSTWYTDISLQRPTDIDGYSYSRLFAEEHTGYASIYPSSRKDTDTLCAHLDQHASWVATTVPGGKFTTLKCDFGSEIARQNHGNQFIVAALSRWLDDHPGFRVIPCPPYRQAYNKSENTWGRIHGLAHTNARRARLGPLAWRIAELGATFQHNHTLASHAHSQTVHGRIRSEALTLTPFDASSVLGYVGQSGFIHRPDAKSNTMHPSAEPVLYVCPADGMSGQLVFNLRNNKFQVVDDVTIVADSRGCSLLLARSSLLRPAGSLHTPDADTYHAHLHGLLNWLPDPDYALIEHDDVLGLPVAALQYTPWLAPDGALLMLPPDARPLSDADLTEPPTAPATTEPPANPPPPPPWTQPAPLAPALAATTADYLLKHPDTPLSYRPGHTKRGLSGTRWAAYSTATTVDAYRRLQSATPGFKTTFLREDLKWDLEKGHLYLPPSPTPPATVHRTTPIPTPSKPRDAQSYADEAQTLALIDSYEPTPPPGHPLNDDSSPLPDTDPRTYTTAYAAGLRVLRASLASETLPEPDNLPSHPDPAAHLPASLILEAAPQPKAPIAPASIAAARRLPDFDAPNGWLSSIKKHLKTIESFNAWILADISAHTEAIQHVGEDRVSVGNLVAILVCKLDTAGDPRDPTIVNKFRIALSDPSEAASGVPTFSSCVAATSNRIITAIAPALDATQTTIDVSSAYYHGTPDPIETGGRYVFARIPLWLSELFPDRYPQRDSRGRRNILRIPGNMPGRCDGGRIWQRRFDTFLRSFGLTQLLTDRRVWVKTDHLGSIIVHDHVDDSRLTSTTTAARDAFHTAWATTFNEKLEGTPLSEDFTGLRHHAIDGRTLAISCDGVLKRLKTALEPYPLLPHESCKWPLARSAFLRLRDRLRSLPDPSDAPDPLVPHLILPAQALLGSEGFVTGLVRADGYFGFSVLSRLATPERLTALTFRCIVILGHYLVNTKHLRLHLTPPPLTHLPGGGTGLNLFSTYVDASNGNWIDGCGFGGVVLSTNRDPNAAANSFGGGALSWCCIAPKAGDDSSGAAELRLATLAYKHTLATRFLQAELNLGVSPTMPTPLYCDSSSVLDGYECERITRDTRWMAMRYAMIRWGKACATIEPLKLHTDDNPADGNTKCLIGAAFENARDRLLGYPVTVTRTAATAAASQQPVAPATAPSRPPAPAGGRKTKPLTAPHPPPAAAGGHTTKHPTAPPPPPATAGGPTLPRPPAPAGGHPPTSVAHATASPPATAGGHKHATTPAPTVVPTTAPTRPLATAKGRNAKTHP